MNNGTTYEQRMGHPNLCTARRQDGKPCGRYAVRGGNVCRVHGGAAPQVVAAAKRRLQAASDALAAKLLGIALDDGTSESVRLQAIKDALDRGGVAAKAEVELSAKQPEPWETMMMDFARVSRERHEALARGEIPPPATQRPDVLDAEVLPDPAADRPSGPVDGCAGVGQPAPPPPHFAKPSAPPSRELATAEDAVADAARANRAARVSHTRRKRS